MDSRLVALALAMSGCVAEPGDALETQHSTMGSDESSDASDLAAASPRPRGIPFAIDPGVSAASWGLNTNDDGIQNFGESALDCGGASASRCRLAESDLEVVVASVTPEDWNHGGTRYRLLRTVGTIDGHAFETLEPDPDVHLDLPRADLGVVLDRASRPGNLHTPAGAPNVWPTYWNALGAMTGVMQDGTNAHPTVFAVQQSVELALHMRASGRSEIVANGGSFGGAVALISAFVEPDLFDGIIFAGAPYGFRSYKSWGQMFDIHFRASGGGSLGATDPDQDGIAMILGQYGMTVDDLDVHAHPELLRVPTLIVLGADDPVFNPVPLVEQTRQKLADAGIDWVRIDVVANAGHGEPSIGALTEVLTDDFLVMLDRFGTQPAGVTGPHEPSPRSRDATYDDFLLEPRPLFTPDVPAVTDLWSLGHGSELGEWVGSATLAPDAPGEPDALYTGSLEGIVTKRRWLRDPGQSEVVWSAPTGLSIQSIEVADVDSDGTPEVFVGDLRGLHVLDSRDGRLLREDTSIPDVRAIAIGELFPDVDGLELVHHGDGEVLRVESAATGETLSVSSVGLASQLRIHRERVYALLARGHVARFRFDRARSPVADWISEYLAQQGRDMEIVPTSIGTELIAVSGTAFANDQPRLVFLRSDGAIDHEIALPGPVENLQLFRQDALAVGVAGTVWLYNVLESWQSPYQPYLASLRTPAVGSRFVIGRFHDPVDVGGVVFDWKGGLQVLDGTGRELERVPGHRSTSAIALWHSTAQDRWEVSLLGADYRIRTYRADTGELLGTFAVPFTWPFPRRMIRTAEALAVSSFELFGHDGDVATWQGADARVSRRCGSVIFSIGGAEVERRMIEAGLVSPGPPLADSIRCCAVGESSGAVCPLVPPPYTPPAGAVVHATPRISAQSFVALDDAVVRLAVVDDTDPVFIASTPGGDLYLIRASAIDKPVRVATGLGQGVASLEVADLEGDGDLEVVAGAWLRDRAGKSLWVFDLDPDYLSLAPVAAIDAGHVTGLGTFDLDGDGDLEIVLGEQNGNLRILDAALAELYHENQGDLNVGDRGFHFVPGPRPLVGYAASGRFRMREVSPDLL